MQLSRPAISVAAVEAWLPQTQCTQCGFPHCRGYAEALVRGDTDINRCPPGGDITIHGLAALLGRPPRPLDPACGHHQPRRSAMIDESLCIGCTLCLQACPVDAIVGATKLLHTVVDQECTGCDLCVPTCPVDCIVMRTRPAPAVRAGWRWPDYSPQQVNRARRRFAARTQRIRRRQLAHAARRRNRELREGRRRERLRADIAAAVKRVRARRRVRSSAP